MFCVTCVTYGYRVLSALLIVNGQLFCVNHAPHVEPTQTPSVPNPVPINYLTTPHMSNNGLGICSLCGQGLLGGMHLAYALGQR